MAEVYWIHLPEHTDMFTEGYIGVTKTTAADRYKSHVNSSRLNKKHHLKISYAIRKYGADNLIVETLVICDEDYSLWLEEKLRPELEIGWNLAKGGSKPPVRKGPMGPEFSRKLSERNSGVPKSEETKRKISETLMGHDYSTPESRQKARETFKRNFTDLGLKRKSISEEVRCKTGSLLRKAIFPGEQFWRKRNFNQSNTLVDKILLCSKANLMFDLFSKKDGIITCALVADVLSMDGKDKSVRKNIGKYLSYFKAGWNPNTDSAWLEDFKKEDQDVPRSMAS